MAIEVDRTQAIRTLNEAYVRCIGNRKEDCLIKETIDFVLTGHNCLTYRYIMFTALVAKATNPDIDILSLQAQDQSEGAYDARSLASKAVYPFQMELLGNVLDGSNNDPLVNKPGRFNRLDVTNPAAGGDPKRALRLLCRDLPQVEDQVTAFACVEYIVSQLLNEKERRDALEERVIAATENVGLSSAKRFLSDLLDQGFGGASLVLVTTALYSLIFPAETYSIVPHPANQAGTSTRQFSDLDLFKDGQPFLGTELKDRPFSAADVERAANTAIAARAKGLLFVAGRQSTFATQPPTYFNEARETYGQRGLFVGVISIDALIDFIFATHANDDFSTIFPVIRHAVEEIGAIEAQIWIYRYLTEHHLQ